LAEKLELQRKKQGIKHQKAHIHGTTTLKIHLGTNGVADVYLPDQ